MYGDKVTVSPMLVGFLNVTGENDVYVNKLVAAIQQKPLTLKIPK